MKKIRLLGVLTALLALTATACSGGDASAGKPSKAAHAASTPSVVEHPESDGWTVAAENQLPGTDAWRVKNPGKDEAIEGFADHVSVSAGDLFKLFVSTTAKGFHVEAYRMGWYGGKQGRLVWTSGHVAGTKQAGAKILPDIYEVVAPWQPSMTVPTKGWPEGSYLLKLVSDQKHERWVPMTIRSASTAGKLVFMNSVTTWAAYNKWGGGTNVYGDATGTDGPGYAKRSRKASFDRPYDKNGSYFNWYELPMLSIAERTGLPMAYETDLELHSSPQLFQNSRGLVFAGHDEYWSQGMRDNAISIRDKGTNIAFFSSNTAYRHIRLENSEVGTDRVVVVYKDASEDPMVLTNPDNATQQWRLPPNPRPESVLTGVYYECNPVYAPFVVSEPDNWMFAGTGVTKGEGFEGLEGVESDRLTAGVPVPRPIQVVADSPLTCGGLDTRANAAYYTVPSGAGVFSSGTMNWSCAVYGDTGCRDHGERAVPAASGDFAAKVTENILTAFAAGPAGKAHPAKDNYDQYVTPPSTLTYTH